jgi:hypothetical protein
VTIESKDRFNPRRGPPIRYVVHRGNCIMPFRCWRALKSRNPFGVTVFPDAQTERGGYSEAGTITVFNKAR